MIQISEFDSHFIDEKSSTYFGFMREDRIEDIESFYDEIAKALTFPDYFGRNLDALEDMLSDLDWIPFQHIFLIFRNSNSLSLVLEDYFEPIFDILSTTTNERLEILLID
nr:barstar family protein [Chitinophagaceae bacterium]